MNLDTLSFKWVWKSETLPKIQFLIWLCLYDSLPMAYVLGSRGLILDPLCKLCYSLEGAVSYGSVVFVDLKKQLSVQGRYFGSINLEKMHSGQC